MFDGHHLQCMLLMYGISNHHASLTNHVFRTLPRQILNIAAQRQDGESISAYIQRQESARQQVNLKLFTLVHAAVQVR